MSRRLTSFVCFSSDEMFCNWPVSRFRLVALHVGLYISFEKMSLQMVYPSQFLTSVDMFRFLIVLACQNRARCPMDHFALDSVYNTFVLVSRCIPHQVLGQGVVLHERCFLYRTRWNVQAVFPPRRANVGVGRLENLDD